MSLAQMREITANLKRRAQSLNPGTPVMSGHWWVFLKGKDGSDAMIFVNGNALISPCDMWIVMEDEKFKAWRNSSQRIMWFYGQEVWETYQDPDDPSGAIKERRTDQPPRDESPRGGVLLGSEVRRLGLTGDGEGLY